MKYTSPFLIKTKSSNLDEIHLIQNSSDSKNYILGQRVGLRLEKEMDTGLGMAAEIAH